ncbi:hypothetical protein BpHYR1_016849 [Brachionus plicatilis]|uniref:Uncharacterized protein n=1 Tax=Brachionus plicatilis TaxID=10195 RepID=A0A3M7P4P7_BRAPC|nr:hypothetical protein BpHYR1_016849 [Brachionus plicatilis]
MKPKAIKSILDTGYLDSNDGFTIQFLAVNNLCSIKKNLEMFCEIQYKMIKRTEKYLFNFFTVVPKKRNPERGIRNSVAQIPPKKSKKKFYNSLIRCE